MQAILDWYLAATDGDLFCPLELQAAIPLPPYMCAVLQQSTLKPEQLATSVSAGSEAKAGSLQLEHKGDAKAASADACVGSPAFDRVC